MTALSPCRTGRHCLPREEVSVNRGDAERCKTGEAMRAARRNAPRDCRAQHRSADRYAARASAAARVFLRRTAIVSGPTPPGTGASAPPLPLRTDGRPPRRSIRVSGSPPLAENRRRRAQDPRRIGDAIDSDVDDGGARFHEVLGHNSCPADRGHARMSAWAAVTAEDPPSSSGGQTVTVASRCSSSIAIGLPTISSTDHDRVSACHGNARAIEHLVEPRTGCTVRMGSPSTRRPTLTGLNPLTSFAGSMVLKMPSAMRCGPWRRVMAPERGSRRARRSR